MKVEKPLVSIACVTYNQVNYIRDAIEGFLMQKTTFPFEIIIHDDASTDGTDRIIKEYELKYPNLISTIYQTENQFSKGVRSISATFVFPICQGKYIAKCEGDDYWTDPLKLQKQVDFLERNPEYTFSMGRVDMLVENTGKIERIKERVNPMKKETYTLKDYLKSSFSQTSSFVFRNTKESFPEWLNQVHAGDQSLVIFKTGKGKIKYHKDLFSIYRFHQSSLTFAAPNNIFEKNIKTFNYWRQLNLGGDYDLIIKMKQLENMQYLKLSKSNNIINKLIFRINIAFLNLIIKLL